MKRRGPGRPRATAEPTVRLTVHVTEAMVVELDAWCEEQGHATRSEGLRAWLAGLAAQRSTR